MPGARSPSVQTFIYVAYTLCILSLVAISLWDVCSITSSFIYENKMTSVTRENVSDRFPYLREITFCLSTKGEHFFPIRNPDERRYFSMIRDAWRDQPIDFPENMSQIDRLIGRNLLKLALPMILIANLDTPTYGSFDQHADKVGMDREELEEITDRFLGDPQSIGRMQKDWTEIRPFFIRTDKSESPVEVHLRAWLIWERICFSIPIDRYLNAKDFKSRSKSFLVDLVQLENGSAPFDQRDHPDQIDLVGPSDQFNQSDHLDHQENSPNSTSRQESRSPAFVWMTFPLSDFVGFHPPSSSDRRTQATIDITHSGTYDGSKFPPCTKEYTIQESCLDDLKAAVFAQVCNCTQFSWALPKILNGSAGSIKVHGQTIFLTNFCTKRHYEMCRTRADEEYERRKAEALAKRQCWPCIVHKLSQSLFTWLNPIKAMLTEDGNSASQEVDGFKFAEDGWFPRAVVMFRCFDTSYLVFEERQQFSVPQFISQIGGDLGLYLGFSMISVLNLAAYLCSAHWRKGSVVEKNTVQNQGTEESRNDGIVGKVKKVLGRLAIGSDHTDLAKAVETLMKRSDAMEQMLIEMRDELQAMKV